MKSVTVRIHPLVLAATILFIVPTIAVAAGTILTPPVSVTGSASTPLFTVTQSGAALAIKAMAPNNAIEGISTTSSHNGVTGLNTAAGVGVFGSNNSTGSGVAGVNNGTGPGVFGHNTSTGVGVVGTADKSGIGGDFTSSSGSAVQAVSTSGNGVSAATTGANHNAVDGKGTTGANGVTGTSDTGSGGNFASTSGNGVSAASTSADGVFGTTSGTNNSALDGKGTTGANGVTGTSDTGVGGNFASTSGRALQAVSASGVALAVGGTSQLDGDVSVTGHLTISGGCTGCPSVIAPTTQGERVGEAMLVNGRAVVSLAYNTKRYLVFISPEGDSRGLFVANKDSGEFYVRENGGGRSTIPFQYRVIFTSAR